MIDRWADSFEAFRDDVLSEIGPRPSDQHTLDRKDNDGNYEPGNMRWATKAEQMANRRSYRRRTLDTAPLASKGK